MLSSGTRTFAPASGTPWSETTRPVSTAACPCARAGITNARRPKRATKDFLERNDFVMRASVWLLEIGWTADGHPCPRCPEALRAYGVVRPPLIGIGTRELSVAVDRNSRAACEPKRDGAQDGILPHW